MKSNQKSILTIVLMVIFSIYAIPDLPGQEIEVESTYELSGKAKRGELQNVYYGDEGYTLSYVIRSSKKKIKLEHYQFDNDFRFINLEEEEIELQKAKGKYKWFKGEEEGAQKNLLKVENNLTGQVVLKEGYFYMKCDYYNGVCWWDFKTADKIKPKDETGRKLTLLTYKTDEPQTQITYSGWSWMGNSVTKSFSEATGDLTIICSVVPKIKDAKAGTVIDPFTIMRISVDDQTISKELDFGLEQFGSTPQTIAYKGVINNGNMVMIFAPSGGPGTKKIADPNPLNWRYLEFDPEKVELVRDVKLQSLNSYWTINGVVANGDDVYIYGPGEDKKNDKHYNMLSGEKYTQFSIAKIKGQEQVYVGNTHLDEFKSKLKAPPGQKKTPEYTGKKFTIGELTVASNGDVFISGQNYKTSKDGPEYKDIFAFHFDDQGKLKAQYGIDLQESNKYAKATPSTSLFRETQDGEGMSWNVLELAGYKKMGNERPLMYARIAEINLEKAELGEFQSLGVEGKESYYLEPTYPILPTTVGGDKLTYFGADKAGKEIWFCRVKL